MQVELYERIWMWTATALIVVFVGTIVLTAALGAVHPPGHVETVDPATLATHPEFANGRVARGSDGHLVVSIVASTFAFSPDPIEVPVNEPVTFRLTSADVMHGLEVAGTNVNAMAIPGYVTQFSTTFAKTGQYVIACHEYCGLLHHAMVGTLIVK